MRVLTAALLTASFAAAADRKVKIAGEDLAWRVETPFLIADLSRNPGTGRSCQINTIFLRKPGILLTRARATSTLHLSPNSAVGGPWAGINRWDPPAAFRVVEKADGVRVEREGEMPKVPGLRVTTSYEFNAAAPWIAVEESVTAASEARVNLLRLCEWSFSPGADNPFTHIGWEEASGRVVVRSREPLEQSLPLDLRWQAFFSESKRFGVAAIIDALEAKPVNAAEGGSFFGGDPHYFYRAVVRAAPGALAAIPAGTRFSVRYRLYLFAAEDAARGAASVRGAARE